jgi:hypothetical protein
LEALETLMADHELLRRVLAWLEQHAGWEYGFDVAELEQLKNDLRGAIGDNGLHT